MVPLTPALRCASGLKAICPAWDTHLCLAPDESYPSGSLLQKAFPAQLAQAKPGNTPVLRNALFTVPMQLPLTPARYPPWSPGPEERMHLPWHPRPAAVDPIFRISGPPQPVMLATPQPGPPPGDRGVEGLTARTLGPHRPGAALSKAMAPKQTISAPPLLTQNPPQHPHLIFSAAPFLFNPIHIFPLETFSGLLKSQVTLQGTVPAGVAVASLL